MPRKERLTKKDKWRIIVSIEGKEKVIQRINKIIAKVEKAPCNKTNIAGLDRNKRLLEIIESF